MCCSSILSSEDNPGKEGKEGFIAPEQIEFVKKTLDDNADARWTVVAVHRPLWAQANLPSNGWLEVEKALAGRKHTVFAGHIHHFQQVRPQRRQLLSARHDRRRQPDARPGVWRVRSDCVGDDEERRPDHCPTCLLDGIFAEDMSRPITDEDGVPINNRKATHPVAGQVLLDGCPLPGSMVVFSLASADGKKFTRLGDARIEADGSFVLSSYRSGDGAPVGDYAVTVTPGFSLVERPGKPGPNSVPEKYRKTETTPLKATVKEGKNTFTFELTR